jgi:ACS family hexuronate transporter-like MFS transporter
LPLATIYLIAAFGSVAGGWISSSLIDRGTTVNVSRKVAMLVCALCVPPIVFTTRVEGLWTAVLIIGVAAAAHQGFSANLFTLSSDMFPSRAVASIVGIGGMAGAIGGMLIANLVGHLLEWTGSYIVPFFIAGSVYLLALGFVHLLAPKLEPASISESM